MWPYLIIGALAALCLVGWGLAGFLGWSAYLLAQDNRKWREHALDLSTRIGMLGCTLDEEDDDA